MEHIVTVGVELCIRLGPEGSATVKTVTMLLRIAAKEMCVVSCGCRQSCSSGVDDGFRRGIAKRALEKWGRSQAQQSHETTVD